MLFCVLLVLKFIVDKLEEIKNGFIFDLNNLWWFYSLEFLFMYDSVLEYDFFECIIFVVDNKN